MDIVFPCDSCGKNLVADESGAGHTVACPACGGLAKIPVPTPSIHAQKRMVVRIPSDKTKHTKAGPDQDQKDKKPGQAADQAGEPAGEPEPGQEEPAPPTGFRYLEIVVGWVCIVVGILLELLFPRAFLVYLPFFIGAFLMAVALLSGGRVLQGLVLLLCTCIPAPLLMRQDVWRHGTRSAPQAAGSSAKVQKLVFDEKGRARLVTVDARRQVRVASSRSLPPSRPRTLPVRPAPSPTPPPPGSEPPKPEAEGTDEGAPGDAQKPQTPDDMYRALLEGTAEVPPLVPEDVLASTPAGRGSAFLWQETPTTALLPGEAAPVADIPLHIYADTGTRPLYASTGRLGNQTALELDDSWDVDPRSGKTCIRVSYTDPGDWALAAWQNPPGNWGDMAGGYDLSRAHKLTFWAKGEKGGEKVEFMVGTEQGANAVAKDTLKATTGQVRLKNQWKKYAILLEKYDRSRLITAFLFRIEGQGQPVVFYLDDVQFE